ncbi:MAG: peptide deformylase [Acidimicrobiia bacterium]|nr:peptide deformylase [Acidimicrobiia bacterium]MDH4306837.1 peptide deformylase [Acidimicrobiia bacterium]MDH5294693.1 peptide deformylase [Acidimicrobiia bacterium]
MAILPIRTFGDPVLRMRTAPIADIDDGVRKLVSDMIETMYDAPGVGLAATQVGVSRRICVFDANDGNGAQVLINGEIVETSGELAYDEGCLSVPGFYWEITRPEFARARGLNLDGEEVEYSGEGLMGRVLQHELDHLDGTLLLERLEPGIRKRALRDLRNQALGLLDLGE